MMQRRLFLIGVSALGLSGCVSNLIGPPDAGALYPLRPDFAPTPTGAAKVNWSLSILSPDMGGGLDTDRIALLQPDGSLDYYAKANYPDHLSALVQRALLEGFETSGRIDAVARDENALHADYNLLVEVRDCQAVYATQDGVPQAVVTLNAKLTTAIRGRKIIAVTHVSRTAQASANSTAAAVVALRQALGAAVTAVVAWTLDTAPAQPPDMAAKPGPQ